MPRNNRQVVSNAERIGSAVMGTMLLVVVVWLLVETWPRPLWREWLAALGIGGLGIDAWVSAWQGRRSLLSRVGPLP